ncbi:threonine-phosphate decarboxylase [Paramagnetospirillum marisnigri]|uniref:threonine-phosphate decarboxylase n=1 Tax=Paramagnetospirillum marisnigri TaxID=1285242 RepID=A0A178MQI7_9PROT|nr:threonine-phosphate decarboxylase [Paramagnetospirillum marisnigri]
MAPLPLHGGDLAGAAARWGRPAEGWLDLSTGINPWPYPLPHIPAEAWHRLPGAAEEEALRRAAARCWGVADAALVVTAAGSQPLIQAVPRLLAPGRVAIVSPTYGEHGRAWAAVGHQVSDVEDLSSVDEVGAVVVVNPNNPDGRITSPEILSALAARLARQGGLLVVDEAFGDLRPDLSLAGRVGPGLVVLKSFGKFHGLAGLRLGFALAEPVLVERLRAMMGPWAVSGPALTVGTVALADEGWAAATRPRLAQATAELRQVLTAGGWEVLGGTDLFVLARPNRLPHDEAARLYDRLGRAGILTRAFADRPDRLRFGLPSDSGGLERLRRVLAAP